MNTPTPDKAPVREKIKGVFSSQSLKQIGTGTTARKSLQKTYWFAQEIDSDEIEIQPLNINYVPSGPKQTFPKDEFLNKFSPEPEFYTATVYPKIRELSKTVARADRHRKRGETFSAEFEYGNALNVDEENIRANFGLGLTYLERGEKEKGDDIFRRLVKLDAAFEEEHKHLFNDFGINLRKNNMLDQAIEYYERALTLSSNDENLNYNIARAYFAKGNFAKTVDYIIAALKLNRSMTESRKFLKYLAGKKLLDPGMQKKIVKELNEDVEKLIE
ncbi:tetratricopeptide repeat protein [Desulfoplanes sp. PS50]|jgi:tetratricopeptide (TPR) repeat protein